MIVKPMRAWSELFRCKDIFILKKLYMEILLCMNEEQFFFFSELRSYWIKCNTVLVFQLLLLIFTSEYKSFYLLVARLAGKANLVSTKYSQTNRRSEREEN